MGELDLKLAIGDTFVLPPLSEDGDTAVATVTDLPDLELGSIYHDTVDLRLARSGVTLRYRIGDRRRTVLVAEAAGSQWRSRRARGAQLPGGPADIPAAARDLVSAWARRGHLAPAAALSTRRRRWLLAAADGTDLAELVQDDVSVLDGERVIGRFRELELESRGAALDQLQPIVVALQRAGATYSEPVPKSVRALGPRAAAAPDVVVPVPDPEAPAGEAVRFAMAGGTRRLMENDAPDAAGGGRRRASDAGRDAPAARRHRHLRAPDRRALGQTRWSMSCAGSATCWARCATATCSSPRSPPTMRTCRAT